MGERLVWRDKYNSEQPINGVDWTPRLAPAATIQSAAFTPIDGSDVVIDQVSHNTPTSQCRVSGGSVGAHWVLAQITTNAGEIMEEVCVFNVLRETAAIP